MIQNDIIIALATPAGVGAISVIRLSGENAITTVNNFFKPVSPKKKFIVTSIENDSTFFENIFISTQKIE